jgi:hypothetical protein
MRRQQIVLQPTGCAQVRVGSHILFHTIILPLNIMRVFEALQVLRSGLSQEAEVLDDSRSDRFQELCRRWSDVDKEVPGAIVLPSCEADCQIAVNLLVPLSKPRD